ncbi:hypothetical protein FZW96_14095 [Bacillus sp. BGMRC 2118]|nr:hypothetical protein FZW96_14095 [Bacillus sp. BGMRC 2118]
MKKWMLSIGLCLIVIGCSNAEVVVTPDDRLVTYNVKSEAKLSKDELEIVTKQIEEAHTIIHDIIETDYVPAKNIDIVLHKEKGTSHADVNKVVLYDHLGAYPIYHELTHALLGYGKVKDGSFGGGAGFFTQEGFAEYIESLYGSVRHIPGEDISSHKMMRQFLENERNVPLSRLTDNVVSESYFRFVETQEESSLQFISYIHAGSFVTYLIDEYGLSSFEKIYNVENLHTALKDVYGKDIEKLEQEWLEYIRSSETPFNDEEKKSIKGYDQIEKSILQINKRYF